MAVAWTDKAVGSASKPMTVREPVVADLNLPASSPPATSRWRPWKCTMSKASPATMWPGPSLRAASLASVPAGYQPGARPADRPRTSLFAPQPHRRGQGRLPGHRAGLLHHQGLSDRNPPGLGTGDPGDHPAAAAERDLHPAGGAAGGPGGRRRGAAGELFAVPGLRPGGHRAGPVALSLRLHRTAGLHRLSPALRRRAGQRSQAQARHGRRGGQARRPADPWTGPSACGGSATARPTRGWAPTPPTSCSRPRRAARRSPTRPSTGRWRPCARSAGPRASPRWPIACSIRTLGRTARMPPRRPPCACARGPRPTPSMSWPRAGAATCRACAGGTTCR